MCPAETFCHITPPSGCLSLVLLLPLNSVAVVRKVPALKQQPQKQPGKKKIHISPPHYHQLSQSSYLLPACCSCVVSAPLADKTQFIYCQPRWANLAAFEWAGFCSASRINDNFQHRPCCKSLAGEGAWSLKREADLQAQREFKAAQKQALKIEQICCGGHQEKLDKHGTPR